ncbi:cobalamin biosynthesis protein CbiD [Heliorestis acidaminivorans]|uniref:Cobalt-precorrin-5B C(1)-methyltransferase n=1 Tax=Heliorestis acidaminivorans TaxID=553427 RepID=A0A6I0F9D4_9FIRM|nr:cobalt-precorrin-5B (C(1))-methyltransferase CbiD [Heliorestis acidaminivorans]KAB2954178.1 cobalamin biosynthesis protein CbiD [Heliorestis acidaminivorans]
MRKGYSTGASAAGAAKSATALLYNTLHQVDETFPPDQSFIVEIPLPYDGRLRLKAELIEQAQDYITCQVIKDGGDDPDATSGLAIQVTASRSPKGIVIKGGKGVGRLTKPGLALPVGESAINPVPQAMIRKAVEEVLPHGAGVHLVVSVPEGERIAPKTLNPRLGITGGISILGTTGLVHPMSEEAFKQSLESQIDVALQAGYKTLVLTPGRIGQKAVEEMGTPTDAVILMSNFIGYMLDQCRAKGVEEILLWGHIGKLVKVAGGIFHSHSKIADGRREIMASQAALLGLSPTLIKTIMESNTAEEALLYLQETGQTKLLQHLVNLATQKARERFQGPVEIVFTNLKGEPVAWSEGAKKVGSIWRWKT